MRPDRGERVHFGPDGEREEEEAEEADHGRYERLWAEPEEQGADSPGNREGGNDHRRLVDPDRAQGDRSGEGSGCDEHRRPPRDGSAANDAESGEDDHPADENDRGSRSRVVRVCQFDVEPGERCSGLRLDARPDPR